MTGTERALIWDVNYFTPFDHLISIILGVSDDSKIEAAGGTMASVVLRCAAQHYALDDPARAVCILQLGNAAVQRHGALQRIRVDDGNKLNSLAHAVRAFTYLHEVGHVLHAVAPEIVEGVRPQWLALLEYSENMDDPVLFQNQNAVDDARIALREAGVITPGGDAGRGDHWAALSDLSWEEAFCDLFAVERLVAWAQDKGAGAQDLYLAIMLQYYISSVVQSAKLLFSPRISDAAFHASARTNEARLRADVRAFHLLRVASGLQMDDESYARDDEAALSTAAHTTGRAMPLLARFVEIETIALAGLLSTGERQGLLKEIAEATGQWSRIQLENNTKKLYATLGLQ